MVVPAFEPRLRTEAVRFDSDVVFSVFLDDSFDLAVEDRSSNFLERIWMTNVERQTGMNDCYGKVRPLYTRRDMTEDHTFLGPVRHRANYIWLRYLPTTSNLLLDFDFLHRIVRLLLGNFLCPKQ